MSTWSTPGGDDRPDPTAPAPPPPYDAPPPPAYGAPQQPPYGGPPQPPYGAPQQQPPYGSHQQPPYGAPQPPPPPQYGSPYGGPPSYQPTQPLPHGYPQAPQQGSPYGPPPGYGWGGGPFPYSGMQPGTGVPPMSGGWRGASITLIVLSVLLTFSACGLGVPSLVLGIVAMSRAQTDGRSATRLARIGWVVFGVLVALAVASLVFVLTRRSVAIQPAQI